MTDRWIIVAMALGLVPAGDVPEPVASVNELPLPGKARPASSSSSDLKPVTVVVIDPATKKFVQDFAYRSSYQTPDSDGSEAVKAWQIWHPVRSATGTFVIQAPPSCRLSIDVKSPGSLRGGRFGDFSFSLKAADTERRLSIELAQGLTVRGTVRDAQTNQPIAGATVSPVIFAGAGGFWRDHERSTTTDQEGRFVLQGVDPDMGVDAFHPDYLVEMIAGSEYRRQERKADPVLLMKRGGTLRGSVRSRDGAPLEGVIVEDGGGKTVRSARDGTFVLNSPMPEQRDDPFELWVRKEGYIGQTLYLQTIPAEGVSLILDPLYQLDVQVLTAKGPPADEFTAIAGPGRNPPDFQCDRHEVRNPTGRFGFRLKEAGITWVGVRAGDNAAWEGWVTVARNNPPLVVQLQRGVAVSGKVVGSAKTAGSCQAVLIPQREDGVARMLRGNATPARDLATLVTSVAADGSFRFDHVRPDRYQLRVRGRTITPVTRAVDVAATGLNVGAIPVQGTGRIVGWIQRPKEAGFWDFAKGYVSAPALTQDEAIDFKADENGRFVVDGVPVGKATVCIPYFATADVVGTYAHDTEVVEGRTTEVRFVPRQE